MLTRVFGTWTKPIESFGMIPIFERIASRLNRLYSSGTIYPTKSRIFRVFREVDYDELKVVMLFQDPYHNGMATGIATANEPDTDHKNLSPTLHYMLREWLSCPDKGDEFDHSLIKWCIQGVMPLNCALTVEKAQPKSHMYLWRPWTENLVTSLSMAKPDLVWVLFGRESKGWRPHIVNGHILGAVHPAAEAYSQGKSGFLNSMIYSRINSELEKLNKEKIIW